MHQFFEARRTAQPGALAAVWEGAALTYAELEARANRLAHLLRGLGVRPRRARWGSGWSARST